MGELELQAFRFVSGEMTLEEQSIFEERLATNSVVAIAVSQVIELEAVVSQLPVDNVEAVKPVSVSVPVRTVPESTRRSAIPVVAAVSACLLVAMLLMPADDSSNEAAGPVVVEQRSELIDNWLEAVEVLPVEPAFSEFEEDGMELAMLDSSDTTTDSSDEIVPGWMFAAFQDEEGTVE